jgi:hypothetical protein
MSSTYPVAGRTGGGFSRRIGATILIALAAILLASPGGGPAAGSTYVSDQAQTYQDFGGTIRNTGAGWFVINDAAHEPDSITIGAVTTTSVQVHYPACDEVVSVIVAPDDTYATTYGAVFGASVGLSFSYIKGSVNDGSDAGTAADVWDPTTDYTSGSNIWISGRCEVSP